MRVAQDAKKTHAQSFDVPDSAQDAAGSAARLNGAFGKNERHFCARWEEILALALHQNEKTLRHERVPRQRKEYYYAWSKPILLHCSSFKVWLMQYGDNYSTDRPIF